METSKTLIQADYQGIAIAFTADAWFNATAAATKYGKQPGDWLKTEAAQEYVSALSRRNPDTKNFVSVKKGGNGNQGTWMHPKLAIVFARWLDADLAVWCDETIDSILRGKHPHFDWRKVRIEAAGRYSVMSDVLKESREDQGKDTKFYHYANEALMINEILTGERKPLVRDALSGADLRLLARLEAKNTVLLAHGYPTPYRKPILARFAAEERAKSITKVTG